MDLAQELGLRVALSAHSLDLLVVGLYALVQLKHGGNYGFKSRSELWWKLVLEATGEKTGVREGYARSEGLHQASRVVGEQAAHLDECRPAAKDSKIGLRLCRAMRERGKKRRIQPANARQVLGVHAITFVLV